MTSAIWLTLIVLVLIAIAAFPRETFAILAGAGALLVIVGLSSQMVRIEWVGLP